MTELELKFSLDGPALASLRAALIERGARAETLQARYFDTSDARLSGCGMSLRLRQVGGEWRQTLKAAGDSLVHRLEHEVVVRTPGRRAPALDLSRHLDAQAQAALRAALGDTRPGELVERFTVRTERLRHLVTTAGGSEIEIALDRGAVLAGGRSAAFCELELELKAGPSSGLFELAQAWAARGGLWLHVLTKSQRGHRALSGQTVAAANARPVNLPAALAGGTLWRLVLRSVLDQVIANAAEVVDGCGDNELIHQLRVGLRRLRTALRELAPLGPAIDAGWTVAVADAFGRLGAFRDDEAAAKVLRALQLARGTALDSWARPQAADAASIVRRPAFQVALVGFLGLAHGPEDLAARWPAGKTRKHLSRNLEQLHGQVSRAGQRFDHLPLAQQHQVRKRLKRLRYLAEFLRSLWPSKRVDRYLKRLQPALEALGRHNDVVVAMQRLQDLAQTDPLAAQALLPLQAQLAAAMRAGHRALQAVDHAPRFWAERRA